MTGLRQGKRLPWPALPEGRCAALDEAGALVALCEGVGELLRPVRADEPERSRGRVVDARPGIH